MACMKAPPHYAPTWRQTAVSRAGDVSLRLSACLFVALAAGHLTGSMWPLAWLVASVVLQLGTLVVLEPVRTNPDFEVSRLRGITFILMLGLSAISFSAVGALLWFAGGWAGRLCAMVILAGGCVHATSQAQASARQLWALLTPFLLLLTGLPLFSLMQTVGDEREAMALVALCGAFFAAHMVMTGRGGVAAARSVGQAMSDAKRAILRAEAADAAKGDFLAVMSHELRTPLNGVLGMAQIMETDELSVRQRDRLSVVKQSGEALLVLVNDLLDIARIEDESLELEEGLIDLPQLAAQTETLFAPLAQAKHLSLRVRLMESAGVVRAGDPARVRQVLHNLVGNAIKFTENGRVAVVISGSDDELVFDVTDTGPGVAPDRLATIFERFTQSDGSASRRHGGSGLGLAITRGLARLMSGELSVRSQVGEGSVFTARLGLPMAQAAIAPSVPASAGGEQEEEGQLRIRILAAEDNHTNQLVLKTLLEQLGISIHVVENGEEAVAAWRASAWDLVLMDIQMPLMDGLTATKQIREMEALEGRVRTPIIAVTANATAAQAATYVEAGMDGLVPKPIHFAQLLAAISGAIEAENDNVLLGQVEVG